MSVQYFFNLIYMMLKVGFIAFVKNPAHMFFVLFYLLQYFLLRFPKLFATSQIQLEVLLVTFS